MCLKRQAETFPVPAALSNRMAQATSASSNALWLPQAGEGGAAHTEGNGGHLPGGRGAGHRSRAAALGCSVRGNVEVRAIFP